MTKIFAVLAKQAPWELFRVPALLELQGVQPAVDPACGQQFPVGPHLAHLPLVHHDDPVGNTVDLEAANWTNTIGASELATVWTDPDFDPNQKTFYYARVIEIPTPRWVLYDKVRLGAKIPKEAKLIHQERAYTSPIWYTP